MEIVTRGCRAEELEALVELTNRVFRPRGDGDMRREYPLVFDPDQLDGMRIVPGETGPVAHVGVCVRDATILGARLRVASIGAVCTDTEQRGRGIASALMADACRYAREQGASLMLISGGRGLYHRLGYVTVGCFWRYQVNVAQLDGVSTPGVELAGYREEELSEIAALHQAEPVRFFRSAADWKRLLAAGVLMNASAELLTVRQEGHLVAYLGLQVPGATESAEKSVRVQEMGGSRRAIMAVLPALPERYGATTLTLTMGPADHEMAALARQQGWSPTRQAFSGTLGVIDPPVLLEALGPLLWERAAAATGLRITASDEGAVFELGQERYTVEAPGPLAALIFGGETEEALAVPPREGALGELLETMFPLPLLWYGYNYV